MHKYGLRRVTSMLAAGAIVTALAACSPAPGGSETNGSGSETDPAPAAEGGGADEPVDFDLGVPLPTWNAGLSTLAVSMEMGYFEEEGLNTDIILMDSGTTLAQQLNAGSVQAGPFTPEPVLIGHQPDQNLDMKYFMAFYTNFIYGVRVLDDSPIQSIADLEGKRIGSLALGTGTVIQLRAALTDAGLDPDTDVEIIPIGAGGAQQVAAIENGEVDALALSDTAYAGLENQGFSLRKIPLPWEDQISSGGVAALTSELEANPELYERLGRAILKGIVFSAANPEAAIRILFEAHPETIPANMSEEEGLQAQVHVLETRLDSMGASADMTEFGALSPEGLQANTDVLLAEGIITEDVPVDAYWTDELLNGINDFDFEAIKQAARDY